MSESLKKLPYFASWEVKKCVDNVFAERNSTCLVFTSNFVFQKLVPREHLKIFLGVSLVLLLLLLLFFVFFFCLFFFGFFFLFSFVFFFVPR